MAYGTREEVLQLFGEPEVRNKIDTESVTTKHTSIWSLAIRYSRNVLQQDGLDVDTPLLRGRFELSDNKHVDWVSSMVCDSCGDNGDEKPTHDLLNLGGDPFSIRNDSLEQSTPYDLSQRGFYRQNSEQSRQPMLRVRT
jgi:hypothetical protein